MKKYTADFKLQIVLEILKEGFSWAFAPLNHLQSLKNSFP